MSGKPVFPRFVPAAVVAVTLLVALSARPARAASLVVDSAGDNIVAGDGDCTLREAIRNANNNNDTTGGDCVAGAGADTITFDASLSGATITLGSALPHVSGSLAIDGNALALPLTVDGVDTYRVFHVNAGAQLTLQTLSISNGGGPTGGGLYVEGSASVTKSTFSSNDVSSSGGAILNAGSLTVTTSTFSANSAGPGGTGGGIHNAGTATVMDSTFSGNSAGADGGAISNASILTVTNTTFSGNSAPSGGGGALANAGGTLAVTNSTFSANSAGDGGGIVNTAGTLTVKNSTLSDNGATDVGGGIYIDSGTFHYANTIIANSAGGGDCLNNGTLGTNTSNLVEDGSCFAALSGDPSLDALDNYGGPTYTFALMAGSPAIDAGHDTTCVTPPVSGLDQRGFSRPLGTHCDIGALENDHQYGTPSFIVNATEDTDDGRCDFYLGGKTNCTLREAINHANARSGADTITFDSTLSGATITLGSALPTLNGDVIIDGSAPSSPVSIDGNHLYRPFLVGPFTVTLKRLVIIDGESDFGGAIYNDGGDLEVNGITFSGNHATIGGAGIWNNSGALAVTNSTFSGNSASDLGGGIYNNGTLTVTNSTLSGNTAINTGGGGIYNELGTTATVSESTFSANETAPGSGAGILNAGTLNVSASTFKTNTSSVYGGGIYNNDGTATVSNSTFSANTAGGNGGGIYSSGTLTLVNGTLSGNGASSGGGVNNQDVLHLANTIIANSTNGADCVNGASLSTNTNNLVQDGSCSAGLSGDPMLGPLANNGGPTQTMALLVGSIALDAGDDTVCSADPVNNLDQRGHSRPFDGDGDGTATCDMGAFEHGQPTTTLITADTPDPSVPGQLVAVTVTVSEATAEVTATPTGTVSISGANVNCTITLVGGTGTCSLKFTSGGNKTVRATYSGDEIHAGSSDTEPHVVWFMTKFLSQSGNDGWVLESSENSNAGGTKNNTATTLRVGDDANDKQYRSILSFNTAGLPDTALIKKVMIYIKRQSVTGTNPIGTHGAFRVDIKQPYFGAGAGLTLQDFAAAAGRSAVCTIGTTPANNWYNGTFGSGAFAYINKTGTTQLRLRFATDDNNDNGADVLNLYSGNAVSSNRPYIIVYYMP